MILQPLDPNRPHPRLRCRPSRGLPTLRLQFEDAEALLRGFARAQEQSWVGDCVADVTSHTLEIRPLHRGAVPRESLAALRGDLSARPARR